MCENYIHLFLFFFFFWTEIRKVLSKISKEKGCEVLGEWIKPCKKHLHWSATSTFSGNKRVIWAKFKTFLSHVVKKQAGLEDPLFNKCAHGVIETRKWLKVGMVYTQLCIAYMTVFWKSVGFYLSLAYKAHKWWYFFPYRHCCIWQIMPW